jgi:hypothetical protein
MAEPARAEVRYTAFLSYSHADAAVAGRLHRRLEAYRMPKRLVGSQGGRGPVPDRLWPIFRDREELPAATDLSETVRAALGESGALIILCSPAAAGSLWVAEEIDAFRTLHPDRPILAAILDGDPPDCFPAALRAFGRDGTWHEPLATDLRPGKDGKHLGLLKLVAGITGVGLDALVQRDAARRIRRVMAVTGLAIVAMLIMGALAVVAVNARREAERQRAGAEGLIEFMHRDLRKKLGEVRRLDIMRTVNLRALEYYDRQLARSDRPRDRLMRARVLQAIGQDDLASDRDADANRLFTESYQTTSQLLAADPNDEERVFGHSQSEFWVGMVAYGHRDSVRAQRRFERYKALVDRLLELNPSNPAWIEESAYAEGSFCAVALRDPVDRTRARRHCFASLARMLRVYRLRPNDPEIVEALANRHAWAADVCNHYGRWDLVIAHRARYHDLLRKLMALNPRNYSYQDYWMSAQLTFAQLLVEHGELARARPWFAGAAATNAALRAHDPENANWRNWEGRIARAAESTR